MALGIRSYVRSFVTIALTLWLTFFPITGGAIAQIAPSTIDRTSGQPRWEQVSLSDLGTIARSGSLQALGRTWRSGQTPDQFLALEDLASSLAPQEFNLAQIGDLVGFDPQKAALSEFPMATNAALSQLAESVPQLKEFPIAQIPPVAELASQLGVEASDIQSTLDEALSNSSSLGSSQLSQLSQSLNSYSIGDIPNLDKAQLKDLPGWEKAKLSEVPGLGQVPLSSFPNPLALGGAVMRIDAIYGTAETSRDNTISGSSEMGFSVKCAQPNEKCAYIELDNLENSGREQRGSLEGKQWISGKYQSVEGGSGCLKIVNGGKEPTGRHPFGEAFKVVVMEPDETKDEVNTALFFRFCTFCGCTPYFLGPIPFLSYRRDDNIFVGALKGGGGDDYSEPWDLPDWGSGIRAQLEAALAAAGVSPCGSGYSGNYASAADLNLEGVPLASGNLVNRVVAAVPNAYQHSKVKTTVQQIVGAALERGITDPAHIAYMLATAQYETTMGRIAVEGTGTRSLSTSNFGDGAGGTYYGRGLGQLTGSTNYQRASDEFGVDFVNNPELAADPKYSARIMAWGMSEGAWTGKAMSDYLNSRTGKLNWAAARWVVNDRDKMHKIGAAAQRYYQALGGANADLSSIQVSGVEGQNNSTAEGNSEGATAGKRSPEPNSQGGGESEENHLSSSNNQTSDGTSSNSPPTDAASAIADEFAPDLPNLSCSPAVAGTGSLTGEGDGIATGQLENPAPGYAITSGFGPRASPCSGCSSYHPAVDLGTPAGTSIKAADGGTVIGAEYWDGYGYTVVVDHGNGVKTRYSHLSQLNVQVGQKVSQGQQVALSGSSGYGTGPHLDFGVYKYQGSNWRTPKSAAIDPQTVVNF